MNATTTKSSCLLCGANDPMALDGVLSYSLVLPGIEVCWACAERVENAYYKKHSGRWLTYENPPPFVRKKAPIPAALRTAVFERDAYRCKHCGGFEGLQADHIYPESKGGETTLDNLQTLCRACNNKKGATVPEII